MGWALKSSRTQRTRGTESQKQYLSAVFQTGEQTGHKAVPNNVSKLMRKVRNADGSFTFDALSYLTSQQVASFFSRLVAKKVVPVQYEEDEDEYEGETERMQEQSIQDLSTKVMIEISLQHPIMYDTHNICELVACSKLSKSLEQMLQDICNYYQLDISSINIKRKKPCIDLLATLVDSCSCKTLLKSEKSRKRKPVQKCLMSTESGARCRSKQQ